MSVYGMMILIAVALGAIGFICLKKAERDERAKG